MNQTKKNQIVMEAEKIAEMSEHTKRLRNFTIKNIIEHLPQDEKESTSQLIISMTDAIFTEGTIVGGQAAMHIVNNVHKEHNGQEGVN